MSLIENAFTAVETLTARGVNAQLVVNGDVATIFIDGTPTVMLSKYATSTTADILASVALIHG